MMVHHVIDYVLDILQSVKIDLLTTSAIMDLSWTRKQIIVVVRYSSKIILLLKCVLTCGKLHFC